VRWLLLLSLTASALLAADPLADSAQKKLDSIADRKLKAGAVVTLSPREINAWIHEKAVKAFPRGFAMSTWNSVRAQPTELPWSTF
jgi:hypothetical protein